MRCNRCLKRFKNSSGLWRHLSHSQSAGCKAVYIAQQSYLPGHANDDDNPPLLPTTPEPAVSPVPGNLISMSTARKTDANNKLEPSNALQSDDLPGNEEPGDVFLSSSESEDHGLPSSEDEDEDEEFGDWLDEMDLEAMCPEIEADVTQEDIGLDQTPALNQAQQTEVEQSQAPDLSLEVEQFGGMAGKPIRTGGPTAGWIYQGRVGREDQPENPYAPFGSRVDWEFAKWAKLRGPTSTAVTDLLNIPGVSPQVFLF